MLIRNPIVYAFAAMAAVLLLLSVFIGVQLVQTLQLILVPYTYDITHGVGATGSAIYAAVLGAAQLGMITLTILGGKIERTITRRFVWSIGVVLVVAYFVVTVLGFLINNFH